jgi:hypothetical protein
MDWLEQLNATEPDAYSKCLHYILALAEHGHELRRPMADLLRDGIYELRPKKGRVHYRILYGFHGSHVAVLLHGTTKESALAPRDIDLAVKRLALVADLPSRYTMDYD